MCHEKRLVYVAGPYYAPTEEGIRKHVRDAENTGCALIRAGYSVIVPHTMHDGWDKLGLSESAIIENCLHLLSRCDALLVQGDWENSKGTRIEIDYARKLGIPVYFGLDVLIGCVEEYTEWLDDGVPCVSVGDDDVAL